MMKPDFVVESVMTGTAPYGQYFEVDMEAVLRAKFASRQGVLQLASGVEDDALVSLLKYAVTASDGQPFAVIPSEDFSSQWAAEGGLPCVFIDRDVDEKAAKETFAQGGGAVPLLDGKIDLGLIKYAASLSRGHGFRVRVIAAVRP